MCIGETVGDSLGGKEAAMICDVARRELPTHDFALRRNDDGLTWAVLNPRDPRMLRFTICRIDPCLMVQIEDMHSRRQFRALATIEDVMRFIGSVAETALLAAAGLHGGSRTAH